MDRVHAKWWLTAVSALLVAGCGDANSKEYRVVGTAEVTAANVPVAETSDNANAAVPAATSDVAASPTAKIEAPVAATSDANTKSDNSAATVTPDEPPKVAKTEVTEPAKAPAEPVVPKLLIPHKAFRAGTPENSLRVSYDDIDPELIFDIKEISKDTPQYFPDWLRDLDGKRIKLRGFMLPAFQESGLSHFTLARDTSACCFGPRPKVCYLIEVSMRTGQTTDFVVDRPFDVVGVFHIGDEVSPGKLYTLDDAIVLKK